MTPDTAAYMIAGLLVILAGIGLYVISLIVRVSNVKSKIIKFDD